MERRAVLSRMLYQSRPQQDREGNLREFNYRELAGGSFIELREGLKEPGSNGGTIRSGNSIEPCTSLSLRRKKKRAVLPELARVVSIEEGAAYWDCSHR